MRMTLYLCAILPKTNSLVLIMRKASLKIPIEKLPNFFLANTFQNFQLSKTCKV